MRTTLTLIACCLCGCVATFEPSADGGLPPASTRTPNFATAVWNLERAQSGLVAPPNVFWVQAAAW